MKPEIIILSDSAFALALQIQEVIGGEISGLEGRCTQLSNLFPDVRTKIQTAFKSGSPIIAIMACGAVVRLLADCLEDKKNEPPVIAVSEDGNSVVPLLGGHHGANDLAREIASGLDGHAAITTAGDLRFGVALDAPPTGWTVANPENAKPVMAAMLSGTQVRLQGALVDNADWLKEASLPLDDDGECVLTVSETICPAQPLELIYNPQTHVIGIGCERGTSKHEILKLIHETLESHKIAIGAIAGIASIDLKADESGLQQAARELSVPLRFLTADVLEKQAPRLANPSDIVFAEVGCHGVAEGAALAATGRDGMLVVEKQKSKRTTIAIARSKQIVHMEQVGRTRGQVFVVGIGPGQDGWRSPEVTAMLDAASDLVGYSLYLDLISHVTEGKTRHDFDLGREEDRVRHALELAGEGRDVALVCSGDAGIYAMATLVFELIENGGLSYAACRVEIAVSPGISALQAAAARAGAPLGHDFCTISLSDLLTPWEAIKMRVQAAAQGDFVIAFYNPVSKRRRTQLEYAKGVLLEHRPGSTPVILAANLGREQESVRVVRLDELNIDDVDMLTVVLVGSSQSRAMKTGDGKEWVYTPRGYAAKPGTGIAMENDT